MYSGTSEERTARGRGICPRFLFLSLKMKHFSCLDTNTTNKRECNQLNHESVDVGSLASPEFVFPLYAMLKLVE